LAQIREPGVFIVDDLAFIHPPRDRRVTGSIRPTGSRYPVTLMQIGHHGHGTT